MSVPEPRRYQPRAFGIEVEDYFIEGTMYIDPTKRALDAEGRFTREGGVTEDGSDKWTEYDSLTDFANKTKWNPEQMQPFLQRLDKILKS